MDKLGISAVRKLLDLGFTQEEIEHMWTGPWEFQRDRELDQALNPGNGNNGNNRKAG